MWDDDVSTLGELIAKAPDVDRLPDVPSHMQEAHAWIRSLQTATASNATGLKDEKGLKFPAWMIERVRVFHPKTEAHRLIEKAILEKLA